MHSHHLAREHGQAAQETSSPAVQLRTDEHYRLTAPAGLLSSPALEPVDDDQLMQDYWE
jgi:hypothetical protein